MGHIFCHAPSLRPRCDQRPPVSIQRAPHWCKAQAYAARPERVHRFHPGCRLEVGLFSVHKLPLQAIPLGLMRSSLRTLHWHRFHSCRRTLQRTAHHLCGPPLELQKLQGRAVGKGTITHTNDLRDSQKSHRNTGTVTIKSTSLLTLNPPPPPKSAPQKNPLQLPMAFTGETPQPRAAPKTHPRPARPAQPGPPHLLRDLHLPQTAARLKGPALNARHRARDRHLRQPAAAAEGVGRQARQGGGDGHGAKG